MGSSRRTEGKTSATMHRWAVLLALVLLALVPSLLCLPTAYVYQWKKPTVFSHYQSPPQLVQPHYFATRPSLSKPTSSFLKPESDKTLKLTTELADLGMKHVVTAVTASQHRPEEEGPVREYRVGWCHGQGNEEVELPSQRAWRAWCRRRHQPCKGSRKFGKSNRSRWKDDFQACPIFQGSCGSRKQGINIRQHPRRAGNPGKHRARPQQRIGVSEEEQS